MRSPNLNRYSRFLLNRFVVVSLVLSGLFGCSDTTGRPSGSKPASGNGGAASSGSNSKEPVVKTANGKSEPPGAQIQAQLVDFTGYQAAVAKHKGKVVVVDAWATWCGPCVQNFPHLVELHQKNATRGLACISLSLDYLGDESMPPDASIPAIVKFLTKQGATFDNLVATESLTDLSVPEKLGVGQIPAVFVFDRTGKHVKTLTPDSDLKPDQMYAEVERLVDKLLTE